MNDYQIIRIDPTTRRVTINPPNPPKQISGLNKLIQIIVLAIYNDPGRSVFNPDKGSGLPSLIGANVGASDNSEVLSLISERLEKIREEIIEEQSGLEFEDLEEKLSDLQVVNIDTGVQIDEVIVRLKLITEAGTETSLVI